MKVVRNGILVLDKQFGDSDSDFAKLKGCVLVMCGHGLETDLTGLQIVENRLFRDAVLSHQALLPQALEYAERARALLTM